MKKLYSLFTLLFLAFLTTAWTIKESKENEDVKIIVNDGGVFKEAIKVDGPTANVFIGDDSTATAQSHTIRSGAGLNLRLQATGVNESNITHARNGADQYQVGAGNSGQYFWYRYGAVNAGVGEISSTGAWTLGPADYTGQLNAFHTINGTTRLGSKMFIGKSGGEYDSIGYNFKTTSTNDLHNYSVSDTSSKIMFHQGGMVFQGAAAGTVDTAIPFVEIMALKRTGAVRIGASDTSGAFLFYGSVSSGTVTCAARCTSETASHSLVTASGSCMNAWRGDSGAVITCTDTTSVAKRCLCSGVK